MSDGNNIISDVSLRRMIVKGINEVKRIEELSIKQGHLFKVRELYIGVYEIEIIYRVGDYFNK